MFIVILEQGLPKQSPKIKQRGKMRMKVKMLFAALLFSVAALAQIDYAGGCMTLEEIHIIIVSPS